MKKIFTTLGQNIRNVFLTAISKLPTFLSVIATISIGWYLLTNLEYMASLWSLPLLAVSAGLGAVVIPVLLSKIDHVWSFIGTGLTLLIIPVIHQITEVHPIIEILGLILIILVIGIFIEICSYSFSVIHPGEVIIDIVISLVASLLVYTIHNPIVIVIILLVTFVLMIHFDLNIYIDLSKKSDRSIKQ